MGGSLLTTIRDLHRRRGRERRGLALAEGVRLVEEALAARIPIRGAAVAPGLEGTPRGTALKSALERAGVRVETVSDAELEDLADTDQPQGVVAVIEPRAWRLEDLTPDPGRPVVVLDGVQDPGNVGTILRTTLGLGGAGVVALKGTADLHNAKVVRGSMGALFRLPAVAADVTEYLAWAKASSVETWVTAADGEPLRRSGEARGPRPRVALVLGNEGAGVGAALSAAAQRRVAIPLAPGAESLNVAVAAGILLYEVARDV
ncbi:MAG TPA: RNA methyltransferase [Gemmatimonadales bacterium]|nr:RNA methyltransferase [Gemmatimonadales bacterium]